MFSGRACALGWFGLASALAASVASCAQAQPETARETVRADTVQLTIATDKEQYTVGETIEITITVLNGTDETVTLQFMSGQRFDIIIRAADGEDLWRWGSTRGFVQMVGSESLEPNGQKTYAEQYRGDLRAGTYAAVGVLTSRNYPLEAQTRFTVR